MATCTSCGYDVTDKKFCQQCGTPVQPTAIPPVASQAAPANSACPRCNEIVNPGAAFCNHCGSSLRPQATSSTAQPTTIHCPACQAEVPANNAFCTSCGHNMHAPAATASPFCTNCGYQNTPGVHFCASCGGQLGAHTPVAQPGYPGYTPPPAQYPPQQQTYQAAYGQPQYAPQPSQYPPQGQMGPGYQSQPMMGQQPMALRCPVCMAMAPIGTQNCVSCHTSLANVVPTPADTANMPQQGGMLGGLGGFMQGNGGKYAVGALGGAAALIGGEMLLHGVENSFGGRDEGQYRHRDEGLLGGLGDIANDLGL
jgi:rRNA maturation endonuclease Nob1